MVFITLNSETTKLDASAGDNLYSVLALNGMIIAACGGNGRCGRCIVRFINGYIPAPSAIEISLLSQDNLADGFRLACCQTINTDISIEVLPQNELQGIIGCPEQNYTIVPASGYGIALDIGTTTIAAILTDLHDGRILASDVIANSQLRFGADVISRIEYTVKHSEGTTQLHSLIIADICSLIDTICHEADISSSKIELIVAAGNNTMIHLLANINPASMGSAPYQPSLSSEVILDAAKFLPVAANCRIFCVPAADAFVGGDIIAGSNYIFSNNNKPQLLIDIGTNGEIVLKINEYYYATAVAASPAFEGMSISSGMPAVTGTIDNIWIESGKIHYTTIGGEKAIGIAGSGLIAAVASALQEGIISPSGRINQHPLVEEREGQRQLVIDATAAIYITQKDIRQIQLAKSAIRTGILILCEAASVAYDSISQIYIAGGFGFHINKDSLIKIGMLMPELKSNIDFVGNTALTGALAILLNPENYIKASELAKDIKCLNLSNYPNFNQLFIENMIF